MTLDADLLNDFVAEMKLLAPEMKALVEALKKNSEQPAAFAKFGQLIDRIYGTAATFGLKELATYCGTMKKSCYDCASAPGNKRAQVRVLGLMETCMLNIDALVAGVHDPLVMQKISHTLHLECQKAKKLEEEVFKFVKKAA